MQTRFMNDIFSFLPGWNVWELTPKLQHRTHAGSNMLSARNLYRDKKADQKLLTIQRSCFNNDEKLLLLLTVAIAMLALPLAAHAGKTKWTNPNYDFNKLHRINLVSISVVDPVGSNFTVDDMATEKIISALQKALTKKDYVFDTSIESNLSITKEDASQLTKDALSGTYTDISTKIAPAPTADLKIIAHKFGYNRRVIPAHEEPRTRYYKEKVKDNKGNWIERDAERTVYEYVPASTVYDATLM